MKLHPKNWKSQKYCILSKSKLIFKESWLNTTYSTSSVLRNEHFSKVATYTKNCFHMVFTCGNLTLLCHWTWSLIQQGLFLRLKIYMIPSALPYNITHYCSMFMQSYNILMLHIPFDSLHISSCRQIEIWPQGARSWSKGRLFPMFSTIRGCL